MCTKTCGCQAVCSRGSWDVLWINRVLWPGGSCLKSEEQCLRWISDYKPPSLPFNPPFCFYFEGFMDTSVFNNCEPGLTSSPVSKMPFTASVLVPWYARCHLLSTSWAAALPGLILKSKTGKVQQWENWKRPGKKRIRRDTYMIPKATPPSRQSISFCRLTTCIELFIFTLDVTAQTVTHVKSWVK